MGRWFLPILVFASWSWVETPARAEEDLFTGAAPEKVPLDVQRFIDSMKRAVEAGDLSSVLRFAHNPNLQMSGSAWLTFRTQLPVLAKKSPPRVKRMELVAGSGEEAEGFKVGGVRYQRTAPATHWLNFALEMPGGELAQFSVPTAKVVDPDTNNEAWKLIPALPQIPAESSVRLEEAKVMIEAQPNATAGWVEWAQLNGLLKHREEVEKAAAKLLEITKQKPPALISTQLGWSFLLLGEREKAMEHFKAGVEMGAGRAWSAEYGYAVGLYVTGQHEEAVRRFDRAAGLGYLLQERSSLEEWLATATPDERDWGLNLQRLWLRTMTSRSIPTR